MSSGVEPKPQLLTTLGSFVRVSAACTSQHYTVLLSSLGDVYVMGDCGSTRAFHSPMLVEFFVPLHDRCVARGSRHRLRFVGCIMGGFPSASG